VLRIEDLGPKAGSRKQKRQQGGWRSPARAQYYPKNSIRWETLFVKRKAEKSGVGGEMAGEKSKPAAFRAKVVASGKEVAMRRVTAYYAVL
jgi:hypothetical protein